MGYSILHHGRSPACVDYYSSTTVRIINISPKGLSDMHCALISWLVTSHLCSALFVTLNMYIAYLMTLCRLHLPTSKYIVTFI